MKKSKLPKLSFITPNFEDGKYIEKMVESVMTQDYPNIEQIIVDDGSKDGSQKVLKRLEKKYPRLKVIYLKKNQGACIARNIGAKAATGDYFSFLPADAKLFPGMARIWIDNLEKNKEYDFLYGGYRFIDEQGNFVTDYLGDQFDPYFLETNNYIDGSFPLKAELFRKMGGWDPNIKSLQDWDFWLNAVKNHGAKGLYIADVFFETVLPHAGGLSYDSHNNWLERTGQIKKKYGIAPRDICVTGTGARFHAKTMAKLLGADYLDSPSFKPHNYKMIYLVGFFGNVMEAFYNTNALRVVHWIGSDILPLINDPDQNRRDYMVNWIKNNVDVNLVEFETTRKELESIGLKAQICPLPTREIYSIKPLPKKFTVAVYDPYHNKEHYYPDLIKPIAQKLKDIDFKFFGDATLMGKKENIEHVGIVNDIEKFMEGTSCLLRLSKHDGLPISVCEWSQAGRNIVTNVKGLKHIISAEPNEKSIISALKKAQKLGVNKAGSKHYSDLCNKEKFTAFIKGLMVYEPKKYWESRAEIWDKLEGSQFDPKEEYIVKKELDNLDCRSVLDLGCGNGKWAKTIGEGRRYLGVDISGKLVEIAKKKNPKYKFVEKDMRDFKDEWTEDKFDVIFSYTSLLHIPPEQIEETITKLRKIAKYIVLIEPTKKPNFMGSKSRSIHPLMQEAQQNGIMVTGIEASFVHNYNSYLDIIKTIDLGPRTLMIAKL